MSLYVPNSDGQGGQIKGVKLTELEAEQTADEMAQAGLCAKVVHDKNSWSALKGFVAQLHTDLSGEIPIIDSNLLIDRVGKIINATQGCIAPQDAQAVSASKPGDPVPTQTGLCPAGSAAGTIRRMNLAEAYNAKVDGPVLEARSKVLNSSFAFRLVLTDATNQANSIIVPLSQAVVADARQVWNVVKAVLPANGVLAALAGPLGTYFLPGIQQAQDTKKKLNKTRVATSQKVTAAVGQQARIAARAEVTQQVGDSLKALLGPAQTK